jgi:hypothetical protein
VSRPDPTPRARDVAEISRRFAIPGSLCSVAPLGHGHINDTFLATYEHRGRTSRFVHQRINRAVLTDPAAVMANIERVLAHLHGRLAAEDVRDAERRALTLVPTRDGASHDLDEEGGWWRTYVCVDGAHTCEDVATSGEVFEAAKAFATFVRLLADLPGPPLLETIPDFHSTAAYLGRLRRAVEEDPHGRVVGATDEIAFALRREPLAFALHDLAVRHRIAPRVVHNDTKIDNVLIDDESGEGLCVLDLDTVMPGLLLYDLGDLVRSASSPTAEDEQDPGRVAVSPALFEAIVRGTLAGAAGTLAEEDVASLVLAGEVITYECGVRFLTDHLLGDAYFRTSHPGHNLDRARVQQALLRSLEDNANELRRIVERCRR